MDRLCYRARLQDQRAYRVSRDWRSKPDALQTALKLYEAIPEVKSPPFAAFRRALGRAWCLWRLGEQELARQLAQEACDHAGDGGLVRFRVMALNLLARIEGDTPEGQRAGERAHRLARELNDAHLVWRSVHHPRRIDDTNTP